MRYGVIRGVIKHRWTQVMGHLQAGLMCRKGNKEGTNVSSEENRTTLNSLRGLCAGLAVGRQVLGGLKQDQAPLHPLTSFGSFHVNCMLTHLKRNGSAVL